MPLEAELVSRIGPGLRVEGGYRISPEQREEYAEVVRGFVRDALEDAEAGDDSAELQEVFQGAVEAAEHRIAALEAKCEDLETELSSLTRLIDDEEREAAECAQDVAGELSGLAAALQAKADAVIQSASVDGIREQVGALLRVVRAD